MKIDTYASTLSLFSPFNPNVSKASSTSPALANAVPARTLTNHLSLSLASRSSPSISTLKSLNSSSAASAASESSFDAGVVAAT